MVAIRELAQPAAGKSPAENSAQRVAQRVDHAVKAASAGC
jgi:hypothetical protein